MNAQYERIVRWIGFLLVWPPSTALAATTFGDALGALSIRSLLGWALLSTLSGVTALFFRMDRENQKGRRLPNPGTFIAAQITGAWTMGLVAFLSGEAMGAPGLGTAVSIIVFAFGGAAALEKFVERRLQVTLDKETAALDKTKP